MLWGCAGMLLCLAGLLLPRSAALPGAGQALHEHLVLPGAQHHPELGAAAELGELHRNVSLARGRLSVGRYDGNEMGGVVQLLPNSSMGSW